MAVINQDKLKKRAKRKYLMVPVMSNLLRLRSPLHESYLSTLGCSSCIQATGGKIRSRYCKRIWCGVCAPIKTAIRMNGYKNVLAELGELHITTLTLENCTHDKIKSSINLFRKKFRQFRNTYAKQGKKFRGVYNFECTYNRFTRLYHPHVHIIHESITQTKKLPGEHSGKKHQWNEHTKKYVISKQGKLLDEFKNDLSEYWCSHVSQTSMKGQDTRLCYDLIEGFKYQSKSIFRVKINGKNQPLIPVYELDLMYRQLHGVRCFQAFGITRVKLDEDKAMDELAAYSTDKPDGAYRWRKHTWHLLHQPGTVITDYIPNENDLEYRGKLQKNGHYKKPDYPGFIDWFPMKKIKKKKSISVAKFNPQYYEYLQEFNE